MNRSFDPSPPVSGPSWRQDVDQPSLPEMYRSVRIPPGASVWRKMLAFAGPGFLVAVGYMDPGNWATDLQGGAQFGYTLLSAILVSNMMAILLQHLCIKLGVATGRDLAQACRDHYPKPVVWFLWLLAELAIAACDLAEIIGAAIALQLLFGLPLVAGCLITTLDVFLILFLQSRNIRFIEALVLTLILTIGGCFAFEIVLANPSWPAVLTGFVPTTDIFHNKEMLYIALGIVGATVMPHNLYLHSAIVQSRDYEASVTGKKSAIRFATLDSSFALMFALFINAGILIMAAALFHWSGHEGVADIRDAYHLLTPLLGASAASTLFAVALLASGQNATLTGTLAGQIIMEGFLNIRLKPWLRRVITRGIAVLPALIIIGLYGEHQATMLLVASQVVLSLQLGFAVWPLMRLTDNKAKMGPFANPLWIRILGWLTLWVVIILNVKLLLDTLLPDAWMAAFYTLF